MKKIVLFSFLICSWIVMTSQPTISMLLLDENNKGLAQSDVIHINVKFYSPDSSTLIHQEIFVNPSITGGFVNLNIGEGITDTASKGYSNAIRNYYNSLPIAKRPTGESFLVVKIEVIRKSGSDLKFSDQIKFNSPEPLSKGTHDINSFLNANELTFTSGKNFATQRSDGWTAGAGLEVGNQTNLLNKSILSPSKLELSKDGNVVLSAGSDETLFLDYLQKQLSHKWSLKGNSFTGWDDNFDKPDLYKTKLSSGSLNLKLSDSIDSFLSGLSLNFKNKSTLTSLGSSGLFQQKINQSWGINLDGIVYNDSSRQFALTREFWSFGDIPSKRTTRVFYNGFSSYFTDKPIIQFGVNAQGNPLYNVLRPNKPIDIFSFSGAINADDYFDQGTYNPTGKIIARSTSMADTKGFNPFLYIALDGGAPKAGYYISKDGKGTLFGDIKNFRMDHPVFADKDIVYASLEGPEAAAYCRGTSAIQAGKIFVPFPDHFRYVCSLSDLTIQLTPRSAKSLGMAVTSITDQGFQVEELMNGHGDYEFFWEAKGMRKGFEQYQVVRPKSELMPSALVASSANQK